MDDGLLSTCSAQNDTQVHSCSLEDVLEMSTFGIYYFNKYQQETKKQTNKTKILSNDNIPNIWYLLFLIIKRFQYLYHRRERNLKTTKQ